MRLGLGLSLANRVGAGGISSPIPLSGLSLWLKADAGVTISQTPIITQVILTGFTGIYSNCNGTYNGSDGYYEIAGGAFYIDGNTLYDSNYEVEIAVNNNNYQGAWTPSTYLRTITLSNAGTTSANGVYTRADSQIDMRFVAFSKSGGSITWDYDNGFWYTSQDLYRNYTLDFSNDWDNQNGQGPQPDDAFSNSNRNVGSPTSTITSIYPVESWADQSVNSGALSINNGFASSVVISGKNFISFPSNTNLYSDNPIWADSQIIGTIFCVSRFASSSSGSTALLLRHQGTEGEFRLGRGFNNTNAFFITNDGIDNVSSLTNANNNTNYLLGATFDESLVATLYLNGASTGSGSITNSNGQYNFNVGGLEPSNIAEIVVYNRVLTTPERQQVEAYLMDKYAICLDTTSSVLMTGWVAGPRTLTPIGYAPYGNETYTYGAEYVRYETGVWIYGNSEGGGEIARAYSTASRPWLATWPAGFTAQKICS